MPIGNYPVQSPAVVVRGEAYPCRIFGNSFAWIEIGYRQVVTLRPGEFQLLPLPIPTILLHKSKNCATITGGCRIGNFAAALFLKPKAKPITPRTPSRRPRRIFLKRCANKAR